LSDLKTPAPLESVRQSVLLAVVLISGAAVLVLEFAAGRLFAPWFGMSMPVWSNTISVVLAGLAGGYAVGGRLAARSPTLRTPGWLLLVAGGLSVAAAWAGPALAAGLLPGDRTLENLSGIIVRGSLLSTILVFGPPMVLLGTLGPLAVQLLAPGRDPGRAAGWVLALSTVGSIAGAFLTPHVLLPLLGTRQTIAGSGVVLVACGAALVVAAGGSKGTSATACLLALFAGATGIVGPSGPFRPLADPEDRLLGEYDSPYQFLQVRETMHQGGDDEEHLTRYLSANEGIDTFQTLKRQDGVLTGGTYLDLYPALPLLMDEPPDGVLDVAIIGLAGGTMSSALAHFHDTGSLRIEAAEIDPVAIAAGREHFGMDDSEDWLEIFPVDGRVLRETAPKDRLYDVVIVDAYSSSYYVPFHLTTVEFFRLVKRHLRPGGVLAFNVFAPRNDDPLLRALENTCATAFDRVWNVPVSGFPNFVILATPSASDIPFAGFVHAVNSEKFRHSRAHRGGAIPGTGRRSLP
jgi:predicted membrane-bound spermidine synthase